MVYIETARRLKSAACRFMEAGRRMSHSLTKTQRGHAVFLLLLLSESLNNFFFLLRTYVIVLRMYVIGITYVRNRPPTLVATNAL